MLKYIFYAFLILLLYRLIFHFIIPVYRTTRQVRKGFREMQEKMSQQAQAQEQEQAHGQRSRKVNDKNQVGEYIDFEEVD